MDGNKFDDVKFGYRETIYQDARSKLSVYHMVLIRGPSPKGKFSHSFRLVSVGRYKSNDTLHVHHTLGKY